MTTDRNALNSIIQAEIEKQGGFMPFDHFMALALYHPEHGYYNRSDFQFGEGGDFTTASELSPLYAACFANVFAALLPTFTYPNLLELGAGSGKFAANLLTALAQQNALPDQYFIYEVSPALRAKQKERLQTLPPSIASRIQWIESLPTSFTGIIVANEVLDALPIHRFAVHQDQIKECGVTIRNGQLDWEWASPITPDLAEVARALQTEYLLPNGYQSEVHLNLISMVKSLTKILSQGAIFFADYGYGREEYYHPERINGTLTCFQKHTHHANPFVSPGKQDITAHVDFTRVIEAASSAGGDLLGYTTQAAFLLGSGLMDLAQAKESELNEAERFHLNQIIKTLTLPTEMGERIKIMAISKALDTRIPALYLKDRSREL